MDTSRGPSFQTPFALLRMTDHGASTLPRSKVTTLCAVTATTLLKPHRAQPHRLRCSLPPDHVRRLVGDHQGRGVEIGRDHPRHDRGIDHAQALQPVYAKLVVDHSP